MIDKSCLLEDCVTASNENVIPGYNLGKTELVNDIVKFKFSRYWAHPSMSNKASEYGLPAWSLVSRHDLSERNLSYYYLPLFHTTSSQVEAIMLITEDKNNLTYRLQLIEKNDVSNYSVKVSAEERNDNSFETKINMLAAAQVYVDFNDEIFGNSSEDLVATLPHEVAEQLSKKDVICRTNTYYVTSCQEVRGGQNQEFFISLDCSHSIETVNTCERVSSINTGSSGGGGSSGPSTGNTGGSSTVVTIMNNRCEEDGVGCDEEFPDCSSWVYFQTGNPFVQACGVRNLEFYYTYAEIDDRGIDVGIIEGRFTVPVYFTFPTVSRLGGHPIGPGTAANNTAIAVEGATQVIKLRYGGNPPSHSVMRDEWLNALNVILSPWGGEASLSNSYGTTSIHNYRYNIGGLTLNCRD